MHKKIKDSEIDYSDIPKFTTKQLKKFKRVGRPLVGESPRVAISVRIEQTVLNKIKKKADAAGIGLDMIYKSHINYIVTV